MTATLPTPSRPDAERAFHLKGDRRTWPRVQDGKVALHIRGNGSRFGLTTDFARRRAG